MKTRIGALIGLILASVLLPTDLRPCTTFCLKDKGGTILYGRNFDFPSGLGQVHVNHRNLRKTSLVNPSEKPFTWTSKYGSLSFNQNGREFPYGGMNEAGLVIEQMWHSAATYPETDDRFGLEELQWIQYQLDTAETVEDVIRSDRLVRVSKASAAPLHFLAADARGRVAVLEYLDGRMVVRTGDSLPYPVLANDSYEVSLGETSGRFATAASMIGAHDAGTPWAVKDAFEILRAVSQAGTQWSIVYDLKNRTITYMTRGNTAPRKIEVARFDFSCSPARLCVDIEDNVKGAADFKAYTDESNAALIDLVWDSIEFLKNIPAQVRAAFVGYPATVACAKS